MFSSAHASDFTLENKSTAVHTFCSIVTGKGCPRLIEHIRECHDSDCTALSFAGVQKVVNHVSDKDSKLLQMESRRIIQCNALWQLGLNDRNDFS